MTYMETTEKLESRFHVVLRKGGNEVDATMMGIRAMLMKNFVEVSRPEIRSKVRYERPSSKAEAIRIAIRMEESLEDKNSSLVAREVAPPVVGRSIGSNPASSSTMANPSVDLQNELKSITETLADFKINVVQLLEKRNQNVWGGFRGKGDSISDSNRPTKEYWESESEESGSFLEVDTDMSTSDQETSLDDSFDDDVQVQVVAAMELLPKPGVKKYLNKVKMSEEEKLC
ncbi:hypothetical protein AXG93_1515s1070 [Marchantia polymorpha subsp. ruderalis]|uniref:Uncharacterized protein n=1 Tax=Marchantia polymorpha subsp. ruderalis TaxID=1480154 RepID=A0A176WPT2_MARPO|nr:hypothetical protein AXG93_1515s1070 [Marchantia polymorpha subsp. ruderalis]